MVRLYGALLRLLPPGLYREDGAEMRQAFADLWAGARGRERWRIGVVAFSRLPVVVVVEWMDALGIGTGQTGGWEMGGWARHVRIAARTLKKAPAFAVTTILLIGLGVGAVTTIFTLVDHVLLRPLPYPAADRMITVELGSHSGISYRAFEEAEGVEAWAAGYVESANLTGVGDPIKLEWASVSEDFFPFFGASPIRGRLLVDDDFESLSTVVVSGWAWRTMFGEDAELVGRTIRVDGSAYTVAGILDDDFVPPRNIVGTDVALYRPIDWSQEMVTDPSYRILEVAGRMSPGVTVDALQLRFDELSERLATAYPEQMTDRDGNWDPFPVVELQESTVSDVRSGLNLLLGAVGLLLLVACLNVAHLFLARGLGRVQEMAVRRALGAGPSGLVQQLMAESLVIGALGGALGLLLAWLGLGTLLELNPEALPAVGDISLDLRIAAFAVAVSATTAVLFGVFPALRTIGTDLTGDLRGTSRSSTAGRGTQRLRGGLVIAEVAISLVLVAQAGLLLKSFMQVQARDARFDATDVWTVPLTPTHIDSPEGYVASMNEVLASLESVPGVRSAAYGITQPFEFTGPGRCCWSTGNIEVDGEELESTRLMMHPVSVGYFETLSAPLVAGSVWREAGVVDLPWPTVITEQFAIDLFGSAERALEREIATSAERSLRVVGVAPDIKHYGLDQDDGPMAYLPVQVVPFAIPMAHMAVRLRGPAPEDLPRTLRQAVWRAIPDMPVPTVRSMEDWMRDSMTSRRFDSALYAAFGITALLLAAAGLYGTLLYSVRQRRRELGIRIALGAARTRLERDVVGRGLLLAGAGAVVGIGAAIWIGRRLEERLFEVEATDPIALGAAALVLMISAGLASWLPARRAGRVDPLETLSAE